MNDELTRDQRDACAEIAAEGWAAVREALAAGDTARAAALAEALHALADLVVAERPERKLAELAAAVFGPLAARHPVAAAWKETLEIESDDRPLTEAEQVSFALEYAVSMFEARETLNAVLERMIEGPPDRWHMACFLARRLFAGQIPHDSPGMVPLQGMFDGGPLVDRIFRTAFLPRWTGLLDVHHLAFPPELYLVFAGFGPTSWGVAEVFVFEHAELLRAGVKPGIAATIPPWLRDAARIYPTPNPRLPLTETQVAWLDRLRGKGGDPVPE